MKRYLGRAPFLNLSSQTRGPGHGATGKPELRRMAWTKQIDWEDAFRVAGGFALLLVESAMQARTEARTWGTR